jgi:DNA repair exonuclease SbcCD ATPase subunit
MAEQSITERVRSLLSDDDDNLGPDRGTMDQAEARKERARIEARREKRRELRQQEVEQAREEARQEVEQDQQGVVEGLTNLIEQGADRLEEFDGGLNNADLDGDGVGLGSELSDPADQLEQQVNQNTQEIDELEQQLGGSNPGGGADTSGFAGLGGSETVGFGGNPLGDEEEQLRQMGFDVGDDER